jgi:hypothetical protein
VVVFVEGKVESAPLVTAPITGGDFYVLCRHYSEDLLRALQQKLRTALGYCPAFDASRYAGFWQFPDRRVWVKILANGDTFQCRIGDNTVYRSRGCLSPDGRIKWEDVWPDDSATIATGDLVLTSENGTFRFLVSTDSMADTCRPPF